MSIRLSDVEAWEFLAAGHTGILTTLRRDGWPITLPVWFVVDDGRIYVGTPVGAKKVVRVRHDERASFLVESGDCWVDLSAVHVQVTGHVLDPQVDRDEVGTAAGLLDCKYASFRPASTSMPKATSEHYHRQAIIRLNPVGKLLTWDNSRIRLRAPEPRSGG